MPCDIKIQVSGLKKPINIAKGVDNVTLKDVAKYIMQLPKAERTKLAAQIRVAKTLTLTEEDILKHLFVSNITLENLKNKYPSLAEIYPDVSIEDNYTLIFCNKMEINGNHYYGRLLDALGKEIFVINNYYGAEHFFKYLDAKNKIENMDISDSINNLAEHFGMSPKGLMLNFLNNKSQFLPYSENGKNIVPARILNDALYEITNNSIGDTDLQIMLSNIKQKTGNKFDAKFKINELYNVLKFLDRNIVSLEDFNSLNLEELNDYLHQLFINDPKYIKAKVASIIGGEVKRTEIAEQVKTMPIKQIKELWNLLREEMKNSGITLASLETTLKNNPELINILNSKLSHLPGLKMEFNNGKLKVTYIEPATVIETVSDKFVMLLFPYLSLGETYNYSYNTKNLFSPVTVKEDPELERDGMYKGAYISKYYNDGPTYYAVDTNIISPYSYSKTFSTLLAAKREVDSWYDKHTLMDYGKLNIKLEVGRPRTININKEKVNQIITSLDIQLSNINIKKLPKFFLNILSGTLSNFHKLFSQIKNILSLNTPEKAAVFTLLLYNEGFKDLIPSSDEVLYIINNINNLGYSSYIIEDVKGGKAYLKYLKSDIQLDNDFSPNTILSGLMLLAVNFFNTKFGINIHTLSLDEMETFCEEHSIDMDNIRAFVYEGEIYINSSNANMSDLFHEMSHIFLGVLKTKYPNLYNSLMEHYMKSSDFKRNFKFIDSAYSDFSMQDKIEEAVVNIIAKRMFSKLSLLNSFKGEEFLEDFKMIMTKFPEFLKPMLNTGLEFESFMQELLKDKNDINRSMKISQAVKTLIKNKQIKEFDCHGV